MTSANPLGVLSVVSPSCPFRQPDREEKERGRTAAATITMSTLRALTTRLVNGSFSPDSPPSTSRSCVSAESSYLPALMPRKGLGIAPMSICWSGCAFENVVLTRFHAKLRGCPGVVQVGLLVVLRGSSAGKTSIRKQDSLEVRKKGGAAAERERSPVKAGRAGFEVDGTAGIHARTERLDGNERR